MCRYAAVGVAFCATLLPTGIAAAEGKQPETCNARERGSVEEAEFAVTPYPFLPMSMQGVHNWSPLIEALDLSDEQAKAVRAAQQRDQRAFTESIEAWEASDEYVTWTRTRRRVRKLARKKAGESGPEIAKAAFAEYRKAEKAATAEREELRKRIAIPPEQTRKEVLGVLSPEQRVAWEKHKLVRRVDWLVAGLELSQWQRQEVARRCARWAVRYPGLDESEQRKTDRKLFDEIAGEVIFPSQRERLIYRPLVRIPDFVGPGGGLDVGFEPGESKGQEGKGGGSEVPVQVKGGRAAPAGKVEKPETRPAK